MKRSDKKNSKSGLHAWRLHHSGGRVKQAQPNPGAAKIPFDRLWGEL
jgi:hypothetical protein